MKVPLKHGNYYHIYNRGNNRENLFIDKSDYSKFLDYYNIYINTIADTLAWCLMKNHFHVLVRIKEVSEIGYLNSEHATSENLVEKWSTFFPVKHDDRFKTKPAPANQFKNLFTAYSRWFNLRHNRTGTLFERTFERRLIKNNMYCRNIVLYIHQNPVKHGFVEHTKFYPWSSYSAILANHPTGLKRNEVLSYFGDIDNFKYMHDTPVEDRDINQYTID